jgi:hypothetical protein
MPDDRTPHGGEAMHQPPERAKIPEPKPGSREDHEDSTHWPLPESAERPPQKD